MMKRITPILIALLMSATMMAQYTGKQTLQARMLSTKAASSMMKTRGVKADAVDVVIKLDEAKAEATLEQLKAAGVTLYARLGQQVSVSIPRSALSAVEQMPGVIRIASHSPRPVMMSDVTRTEIRSSEVDGEKGMIGEQPYTGQGVTLAIIDSGFDFQHPAFYDEQGNCRIKAVYMPYAEDGTGVEIDGMTLPGALYDTPEQIAQLTTDNANLFHGSHTAAIAAGTRSPQGFGGVAPDADIVLCCVYPNVGEDEPMPLDDMISLPGLFHSLAYVGHLAKQGQQRVVVNASLGMNNGSHNGKGVLTEAFETLCQQGVPVVMSVGNEGDHRITLHKTFESDDDVLRGIIGSNFSILEGYAYADVPLTMQVSLVSENYGATILDEVTYTTVWQSPVFNVDDASVFSITSLEDETLAKAFNGELKLGVMKGEDGSYLACYFLGEYASFNSHFEVSVKSCQGTELYLFGTRLESKDREGYSDSEMSYLTMSDWATAPDVISVGAYSANSTERSLWKEPKQDTKNTLGDITSFSSFGVGMNGVQCPTLSAPGTNVVSAISHYYIEAMQNAGGGPGYGDDKEEGGGDENGLFDSPSAAGTTMTLREDMMWNGYHYTSMEGTSQASPAVAGAVALWLQADPTLTVAQIKDIMAQSCRKDEFVEASPERFGYGKVDVKHGLELVLERKSTGIRELADDENVNSHRVYMLDGRQVFGTPTRGLYIIDGKKVLVR